MATTKKSSKKPTSLKRLEDGAENLLHLIKTLKKNLKKGPSLKAEGTAAEVREEAQELLWAIETWQNENCDLTKY